MSASASTPPSHPTARHRRSVLTVAVSLALLSACGGGDDTDASGEPATSAAPGSVAEAAGGDTATTTATAEQTTSDQDGGSAGSFAVPDDVCSLIGPERAAELLGTPLVTPSSIPFGCLWRYGDNDTKIFTLAAIPTEIMGTLEDACRQRAATFTDIDELRIGGQPSFAGIDVASTGDTLVVCFPDVELVASGHPDREMLAVLMEAIVTG